MPIALEPPPTQAATASGSRPTRSSTCARASCVLAEARRVGQRRRPPAVVAQQTPELVEEVGVVARDEVLALQLVESGDERLRDEAPTVRPEMTATGMHVNAPSGFLGSGV